MEILKRNENLLLGGFVLEQPRQEIEDEVELQVQFQHRVTTVVCKNTQYGKTADNMKRFNPKKGLFVLFYGRMYNNKFYCSSFKGAGKFHFEATETEKEVNVLIGIIRAATNQQPGHYRVSIPIKNGTDTIWNQITLYDHPNNRLAERISKVIPPGQTMYGFIVCSKEKLYNGNPTFFGNRFFILSNKKTSQTQPLRTEPVAVSVSTIPSNSELCITFGPLEGFTLGQIAESPELTKKATEFVQFCRQNQISFYDERDVQLNELYSFVKKLI